MVYCPCSTPLPTSAANPEAFLSKAASVDKEGRGPFQASVLQLPRSPLPTAFSSTSSDSVCSSICEHVCCAFPPSPPESICLICLASDVGNTNIRESLYSPHAKARIGLVAEKKGE